MSLQQRDFEKGLHLQAFFMLALRLEIVTDLKYLCNNKNYSYSQPSVSLCICYTT